MLTKKEIARRKAIFRAGGDCKAQARRAGLSYQGWLTFCWTHDLKAAHRREPWQRAFGAKYPKA